MKNNIDFFKIDNGTLGVINFNNMIPVYKDNYDVITLNKHNLSKGKGISNTFKEAIIVVK